MKRALITGVTGQDGYFLSELLLEKGYEVHGIARRNSQATLGTLEDAPHKDKVIIHWGDITDTPFIDETIQNGNYDEIYHLAAQSFVWLSFKGPHHTYDVNISGTLNIVNSVKEYSPKTKLYFAATSELYGQVAEIPQKESTIFHPRSPYGVSKLAGFWTIKNYRESYDLFMCSGILFNHESEHRGPEFVTRKITMAAAKISKGLQEELIMGNMDAKRDWGYSKDYVRGMWLMLQQDTPEDFVLATGEAHTVREFIEIAFKAVGINISWEGKGQEEVGKDSATGTVRVRISPEFYRPAEVELLLGDATLANEKLGWIPEVKFEELVNLMVEHDLKK